MSTQVQSIICHGSSGTIIDIECHLSNNLPNIVIVGFANKAVNESRERIRGAFATSHIRLPRKRITINLAPADVPKDDSGFDLPIAIAILLASGDIQQTIDRSQAFIGELSLDGSLRPVRGIIGKLLAGRAKGISHFYIPASNLRQALLVPGIAVLPLESLGQLVAYCNGLGDGLSFVDTGRGSYEPGPSFRQHSIYLSEIAGQHLAKRALEIAAAGGHNVFFSGPPGTGKSMLAKAMPSILPPLNREEILEVTHLHSLAGHDYERIITERPFRAPHHSASQVAIIGGGNNLRPGEISLAHRGILFFDELPEFSRDTLEALRQPLEDRTISIARAKDTADYPANFILVATANPCPCGYFGTATTCSCQKLQIDAYQRRLSGPILDRIDLYTAVREIQHEKLLSQVIDPEADEALRQRIGLARRIQARRFQAASKLNSDMTNADIKRLAHLEPQARALLNRTSRKINLSARGYMRTVKVARSIADLEPSRTITVAHINEALSYRHRPKT